MNKRDLKNKKFGRLTVVSASEQRTSKGEQVWNCVCECGNLTTARTSVLTSSNKRSCGCLRRESSSKRNLIHGGRKTPLYSVWSGMHQRCGNKNNPSYRFYGARGVSICNEWSDFAVFRDWAYANGYEEGLSIDRINPRGDYKHSNCRWATQKEQQRNRRDNVVYGGVCATDASVKLGGNPTLVHQRIYNGWDIKKAFTHPVMFRES